MANRMRRLQASKPVSDSRDGSPRPVSDSRDDLSQIDVTTCLTSRDDAAGQGHFHAKEGNDEGRVRREAPITPVFAVAAVRLYDPETWRITKPQPGPEHDTDSALKMMGAVLGPLQVLDTNAA